MNRSMEGAVCAIIVAAGKGSRMGLGFNKVLAPIKGAPVLSRTIGAFVNSRMIDRVILVISPDDEGPVREMANRFSQEIILVHGGPERQQSVYNGLMQVPPDCGIILIHDGARPFVDDGIIKRSIDNARRFGAACAGMPVKDTIKCLNDKGFIIDTPSRESLWIAQTPQSFRKDIILRAHENALEHGARGTDDAMLVESMGIKVKMFEGSYRNIKITSIEDLAYAEAIAAGAVFKSDLSQNP